MRVRFYEHVLHVGGYGALTQPKLVSDFLVPQALAHEIQDLAFALGELVHNVINMNAQLVGASLLFNFLYAPIHSENDWPESASKYS